MTDALLLFFACYSVGVIIILAAACVFIVAVLKGRSDPRLSRLKPRGSGLTIPGDIMKLIKPLAGAAMACLLLPLVACGPTILSNPANKLNVGVLGKTYAAAQKLALAYDGLPYCSKAATLLCSQPKVVIAIDTADKAASLAWGDLVTATNTPNVDLTDAFAAAQSAVATLQHIEKLYNAAGATS